MAHLQYMPGDPRLVDQLVYELKSKGIFDQFRKDCIADVDTRPAYQNLRQRVESSVALFLSRQTWKSDLNKNQLREKLRKHILDGNYLEQGVERIVDQVVNPKVAAVFMPQVEDLVYNYLGIPRKRTPRAEAAEKITEELLPTDLEAVSPGSVKSHDGESKDSENRVQDMEIDSEGKPETNEDMSMDTQKDDLVEVSSDSTSLDKSSIPLPTEEIKLENIPAPDNSPQPAKIELQNIELPMELDKPNNVELKNIELPREPNPSTDIPLPDEITLTKEESFFKPLPLNSEESNSSSGSSIRRNMSPLTPVRNFDDENSGDAQQAFENNSVESDHKEPSTFCFNIETKESNDTDIKVDKKETEQLSYQFNNQVKINTYNTPMYDDSSNSHNLQIDYESDANTNTSKITEIKQDVENSEDSKKERKDDKKKHKSSHRSRDSSRHSSSKDKHSPRDSSKQDKKPSSRDDKSKSSKDRERSKDRTDKRDSSKNKSSHKSSSSSKDKHRSSSSSHRHSSKSSDERKSSSNSKNSDKERSSDKDKGSKDKKDSKSSHRDKDRKSSKNDDKDKKKDKKDIDDHYSSSGRGNHSRRSTDRDSNDGSSSSKGSHNQNNSKPTTENKKESKSSNSKSDTTSTSGESTGQSDKEHVVQNKMSQFKPIVRVDNHLETPIANPPRLPFVPDVTLKKPKFANNFAEAKKMMKMRKFLAEEQKRMNQEAALLLEFQANVRPSLSQVYSSIPGPELEFACVNHNDEKDHIEIVPEETVNSKEEVVEANITEPVELEDWDTKLHRKLICSLDEPLELKQITKDAKEIINDIIGVPVEEHYEEKSNLLKLDSLEVPVTTDITEVKNEDDESKHFLHLVDISEPIKTVRAPDSLEESLAEIVHDTSTEFEITVAAETLSETDVSEILEMSDDKPKYPEKELQYFAEHEKFNAELERHKFSDFLNKFIESTSDSKKMHIINCNTYEENIVKEIASNFGDYKVVNYYKNGHLVPNKNIVKDIALTAEISLPLDTNDYEIKSPLFSPVKSECSFELSSDYDAKLDEIVNKKSRQEVMEIILGGVIDEPSMPMPTIDYYTDLSDTESALTIVEDFTEAPSTVESTENLKRRAEDVTVNKRSVLTPNKIRKLSDSDQISSTTEEPEMSNNNKIQSGSRSKYLGRAKRVGLSRPKRCNLPNSPSSDKSVENYTQNTPSPINGKLKPTPRSKVQRYDTSDLYKPKLHYLSRRNNIS